MLHWTFFAIFRPTLVDVLTGNIAANKRYGFDVWMIADEVYAVVLAVNDVDNTVGHSSVLEQFH